jgi:toxin ParE1/3/4
MPQPNTKGRVVHRPRALQDLAAAAEYLLEESPSAARRFLKAARSSLEALAAMPLTAPLQDYAVQQHLQLRKWSIEGFRKYLVFYRPLDDGSGIEVYAIVHAARDISSLLEEIDE